MLADILKKELQKGKFWTHAWSLVSGCSPISAGCGDNTGGGCWLVRMARLNKEYDLLTPDKSAFNGKIRCNEDALSLPLSSRKRKPRVWAIWSDFYHEAVTDNFRDNAFEIMSQCPSDYFLIVTKRPERAVKYFSFPDITILPNVIHLVTMENFRAAYTRSVFVERLVRLGWSVGILAEPLLSLITLRDDLLSELSWIIAGPENGPGKRVFNPQWAGYLRDQAKDYGVPFMFKGGLLDGVSYLEVPDI